MAVSLQDIITDKLHAENVTKIDRLRERTGTEFHFFYEGTEIFRNVVDSGS
jgi:hypothetical protein